MHDLRTCRGSDLGGFYPDPNFEKKTESGSDLREKPESGSDLREKTGPGSGSNLKEKYDLDPNFEEKLDPDKDPILKKQPGSGIYIIFTS